MREVTQRRIVRCAFLLLCLTPVLATLGWSVVWALPTHTRRIERQIRRQIGVSVSIGLSEHPRPQQLRLSDLQLRDPETDRPLGRINQLTLQHSENTTKLEVDELILVSDQRERLWNCVHDAILGQAVLENKQVQFNIRSVLLVNQSNPFEQHLYDVSGQAWSADNSVAANLAFQLNPPTSSPHLEVTLKRNQTVSPLTTHVAFDTKQQKLPVELFSSDLQARLGNQATAQGMINLVCHERDWQGTFSGTLENVSLERLLSSAPTATTAVGSIQIDESRFTSQGLTRVIGATNFSNGSIDSSIIQRFVDKKIVQSMKKASDGRLPPNAATSFRRLAFAFDFHGDFVWLKGRCGSSQAHNLGHPIMVNDNGDLLMLTRTQQYMVILKQCLNPPQG
ncbi:MAG: hypothetical protein GY768_23090 [Planctomycetaceae bacterium]|nr:hypothetical protein [Planctomycetaceae bacterium]